MAVGRILILWSLLAAAPAIAARPEATRRPESAPKPTSRPTHEDLVPPPTDHPEAREWFLISYVKGTPAQIKATLDKEVIEFANKIGVAQRDLKNVRTRSEEQKRFLLDVLHESADYKNLSAKTVEAKAALEEARAKGSPKDRIDASAVYNKARTELEKMDARLDSSTSLVELKKEETALEESITRFRASTEKSLKWRKTLIDALVSSVSITGPIKVRESSGILGDVVVEEIEGDAALVHFNLFENQRVVKKQEGLVSVVRTGKRVPILVRLGEKMEGVRVGDTLHLYNAFSVVSSRPVKPTGRVLTVEPIASDLDYLLAQILTPPDIDKIAEAVAKATTKEASDKR